LPGEAAEGAHRDPVDLEKMGLRY
jgi:hypothetical protein